MDNHYEQLVLPGFEHLVGVEHVARPAMQSDAEFWLREAHRIVALNKRMLAAITSPAQQGDAIKGAGK